MPIYEYRCGNCGQIMELVWDKFDGGPTVHPNRCPKCKFDRSATKIMSTVFHRNKRKGLV